MRTGQKAGVRSAALSAALLSASLSVSGCLLLTHDALTHEPPKGAPRDMAKVIADSEAIVAAGAREFGNGATDTAVEYVIERFEDAGATVTTEVVMLPEYRIGESTVTHVGAGDLVNVPLAYTAGTATDVELVDLDAVGLDALDSPDIAGKAVLARTPITLTAIQLYGKAVNSNVAAVVFDANVQDASSELRWRTVWKPDEQVAMVGPIPAVMISTGDADVLRAAAGARVSVRVETEIAYQEARSVIARVEGTDRPEEEILFTAHIDSWAAGANDNAVSVATMIELARDLRAAPPRHTIVFAALAGEEIGLFGASTYVRNRHDTLRDTTLLAITLEMLAPRLPEFRIAIPDPSCAECAVESALLESGLKDIFTLEMEADEMRRQAGIVPADQGVFWEAGVPGLLLASVAYPEYHTVLDTMDSVDTELLAEIVDALSRMTQNLDARFLELEPVAASWIPIRVLLDDAQRRDVTGTVILDGDLTAPDVRLFLMNDRNEALERIPVSEVAPGVYEFTVAEDLLAPGLWLRAKALDNGRAGVSWVPVGG